MFNVRVKTDFKKAAELIKRAANLRPALNRCVAVGIESVIQNFRVGGRPPWRPLKLISIISWVGGPKTVHRKTWFTKTGRLTKKAGRMVASRRPLWDTGALVRSVRPASMMSSQSVMMVAGGGAVPYAAIHQFGGFTGRGKKVYVPARPYMMLQPQDKDRMTGIISGYILTGRVGG